MIHHLNKTRALFQKAQQFIPYGVNSNFRYWGEETPILERGAGAFVWDVDGNRYIDYRLGFGPIILGHAYPEVNHRVAQAIENGVLFAATTPVEIELAERFTRMTGMDKVRLCNTGGEANMHALRIARASTGREKFVKFEGNYHGNFDYVMYSGPTAQANRLGPRSHPHRQLASAGIPAAIRNYLISLPYNDLELFERTLAAQGEEVAAVVLEPIMGNVACIMPDPAWLRGVRQLCDLYGILLIFDEVKTGFRLANGGAQSYFGVKADLAAYAKAMGNGFPVAAVAGREAVMAVVGPGRVAHGGTYCGNLVAATAAATTLELLETQPILATIFAHGRRLIDGIQTVLQHAGVPHVVSGVPSMFSVLLGHDEPPTDYRSYSQFDSQLFGQLGAELIRRGVLVDDDPREPWFVSYSHQTAVVDETLTLFEEAVQAVFAHR